MLRTYVRLETPALSDGDCDLRYRQLRQQHVERLAQLLFELLVDEPACVVEFRVRVTDRDVPLDHPRAGGREHLAEVRLRPDRAERSGAGADDERRLPPQRTRRYRSGQPVDGVLQLTRDGSVVLRRGEDHCIRSRDRLTESRDLPAAGLVVLVERRHGFEPVPDLQLGVWREQLLRGAEELRVVRVPAQAARDPDNSHRPYAPRTKYSSATSLTSFCRAGCPFGSGMFQSSPNWVRSTFVSSWTFARSLPKASVIGSAIVPTSSTGLVVPRIVSSPSTVSSSPERCIDFEAKLSSGWRSASKNSGDCRCAARFSSLTSTLATRAEPERLSAVSWASTSVKCPRTVPTR